MQLKRLDQQVMVLFGASSGIGRETALQAARRGARVVVSARGEEGLETLVEEIRGFGGEATAVPAETTDFEQVKAVADTAVERYGRLDTWVHLAAVGLFATFEQTTLEEFRRVIDVNLMGQIYGAKAALPYLGQSGGGALICITSVEARRGIPYHSAYAASKHAVHGFLDVLRMELKHAGLPVSVTEVMPATINTPFFNKSLTKLGVKPVGLPPAYPPYLVAQAILHAAEHPTRDIVVGGSGQMMVNGDRLSPRLMDAMLERSGFAGQRTDEPKTEEDPHSLFHPIPGYDRVEGDFGKMARMTSGGTWRQRDFLGQVALGALALGIGAVVARRLSPNGRNGR